jgi:hypothetical protein
MCETRKRQTSALLLGKKDSVLDGEAGSAEPGGQEVSHVVSGQAVLFADGLADRVSANTAEAVYG